MEAATAQRSIGAPNEDSLVGATKWRIGYRAVAAEQRGAKVKKKLEIDPLHADTVRLIYRLALKATAALARWASRTSFPGADDGRMCLIHVNDAAATAAE